ncbi:hypothetical protein Hanom_Chr04g00319691 [Helianthus anomalus]
MLNFVSLHFICFDVKFCIITFYIICTMKHELEASTAQPICVDSSISEVCSHPEMCPRLARDTDVFLQ